MKRKIEKEIKTTSKTAWRSSTIIERRGEWSEMRVSAWGKGWEVDGGLHMHAYAPEA